MNCCHEYHENPFVLQRNKTWYEKTSNNVKICTIGTVNSGSYSQHTHTRIRWELHICRKKLTTATTISTVCMCVCVFRFNSIGLWIHTTTTTKLILHEKLCICCGYVPSFQISKFYILENSKNFNTHKYPGYVVKQFSAKWLFLPKMNNGKFNLWKMAGSESHIMNIVLLKI